MYYSSKSFLGSFTYPFTLYSTAFVVLLNVFFCSKSDKLKASENKVPMRIIRDKRDKKMGEQD